MKKRFLAILLTLVMALALTVPAMAAPEDWNLEIAGKKDDEVLMGEKTFVLRNWDMAYGEGGETATYTKKAETEDYPAPFVVRVQKGDTIVITNNNGSEFAPPTLFAWSDPDGDGVYDNRMYELKWEDSPVGKHDHKTFAADFAEPLFDDCAPLYGPYDNAYHLDDEGACTGPAGSVTKVSVPADTLYSEFGPNTFLKISPEEGVSWWLLLEGEAGASAQPAEAGTYTVKYGDTWGQLALNNYGSYGAWRLLWKANGYKGLSAGKDIVLPEKLGSYTRLPAQALAEGETLYTVKAGDTLGQIAVATYKDINMYKAIFERNADRLKNANSIYEGQVIVLPVKNEK